MTGHDAKKGEKSNKDDEPKGDDGNKEKKTSDAAEQSTHVSPPEQTPRVGPSASNPDASSIVKEAKADVLIDSAEGAKKLYQALEIKGNIHKVHYQDPRLQLIDEMAARQLLESEYPDEDIEEILREQKLYLESGKTEKVRMERGRGRRGRKGRGGRGRTPMKGVIIAGDDRPATRASSNLPSIPVSDKGKKVLEGPPEVKEQSSSRVDVQTIESSGNVTFDTKLVLSDEEKEDKEVAELVLRKKKTNSQSKIVVVTNPDKRQPTKESEYNFRASQAEKEYFNRLKRAGNIFKKDVSKGRMITTRDHQKSRRGFKSKGWIPDTVWDIKEGNILFKSGGVIQSLSDMNPQRKEKGCELSWEELATKNIKSLAPFTKGGLGHSETELAETVPLKDTARLTEKLSDKISQKHLDELISVQLIVDMHDGTEPKVKMLYFLKNGKVLMLTEHELLLKNWRELEHVLYLLKLKDEECKRWAKRMKMIIRDQKKVLGIKKEEFTPKYIDYCGKK